MFFLWVNIIKIKKINKINFISSSILLFIFIEFNAVSLIKVITKTVKEENIEDTEEYLNIKETASQVNINKKLNWNDKAKRIPKYVATPLPPLNFSQIGKICPKKANKQESCIKSGKYSFVIITGI